MIGIGTTLGLASATSGSRAQQDGNPIPLPGAVVTPEGWGTDISGFFIHVEAPVEPLEAQVADECDFADWQPGQTRQYDAVLIDRLDESHRSTQLPLYVPDRFTIKPGTLFVVNRVHPCRSGYTGIEFERIGAGFVVEDTADSNVTGTEPTRTETDMPGFTVLTSVLGLSGASILWRWIRDDDRQSEK